MTIDYTEMIKLVRLRKKQIEDVALSDDKYNVEYGCLTKIELELAVLVVNGRDA